MKVAQWKRLEPHHIKFSETAVVTVANLSFKGGTTKIIIIMQIKRNTDGKHMYEILQLTVSHNTLKINNS